MESQVSNGGWEIQSKRQDNGLWGMPMQCVKMDKAPLMKEEAKHSALCIGIAERYRGETFEIFLSDERGFCVKLSVSGFRRLNYADYELKEHTLIWLGDKNRVDYLHKLKRS